MNSLERVTSSVDRLSVEAMRMSVAKAAKLNEILSFQTKVKLSPLPTEENKIRGFFADKLYYLYAERYANVLSSITGQAKERVYTLSSDLGGLYKAHYATAPITRQLASIYARVIVLIASMLSSRLQGRVDRFYDRDHSLFKQRGPFAKQYRGWRRRQMYKLNHNLESHCATYFEAFVPREGHAFSCRMAYRQVNSPGYSGSKVPYGEWCSNFAGLLLRNIVAADVPGGHRSTSGTSNMPGCINNAILSDLAMVPIFQGLGLASGYGSPEFLSVRSSHRSDSTLSTLTAALYSPSPAYVDYINRNCKDIQPEEAVAEFARVFSLRSAEGQRIQETYHRKHALQRHPAFVRSFGKKQPAILPTLDRGMLGALWVSSSNLFNKDYAATGFSHLTNNNLKAVYDGADTLNGAGAGHCLFYVAGPNMKTEIRDMSELKRRSVDDHLGQILMPGNLFRDLLFGDRAIAEVVDVSSGTVGVADIPAIEEWLMHNCSMVISWSQPAIDHAGLLKDPASSSIERHRFTSLMGSVATSMLMFDNHKSDGYFLNALLQMAPYLSNEHVVKVINSLLDLKIDAVNSGITSMVAPDAATVTTARS